MKIINRTGFSLVELLASITIISIMIGATFQIGSAIRTNAIKLQTKTQLIKYVLALEEYKSIYGAYPPFVKINEIVSLHDNSENFMSAMSDDGNKACICSFEPNEVDCGKIVDGFGNSKIFFICNDASGHRKFQKSIFPKNVQKYINEEVVVSSLPLAFSLGENYCVTSW